MKKKPISSGILRFALLMGFFLCLFILLFSFKEQSEGFNTSKTNFRKSDKNHCLLLIVSPYSKEKTFSTKHPLFFTKDEFSDWMISLKNHFKNQDLRIYLPLYRTKDNQWLISSKGFFSASSALLKISHTEFKDIQHISGFSDKNPLTLKTFLKTFPKERLFLDVYETNEEKGGKHLTPLIKTPVFITSDNEKFLDSISKFDNFKLFYSSKYLLRFQLLNMLQKELTLPGAGLVVSDLFAPSATTIRKMKEQGKMLFLKEQGSLSSYSKHPIDGIITSFPQKEEREDLQKNNTFCSIKSAFNH